MGFSDGSAVKNLPARQELQKMHFQPLGWEDPLERGMATHSKCSCLENPMGREEPGRLQTVESSSRTRLKRLSVQ